MGGWADWWNSWAQYWGYNTWEWGNTADWLAAIGTVGALLLGLVILRRDLNKENRTQARRVSTRDKVETFSGGDSGMEASAFNANDTPIPIVVLNSWDGSSWGRDILQSFLDPVIDPRKTGVAKVIWKAGVRLEDKNFYFLIQDSDGVESYRGLKSNRRISGFVVDRWERRGRWERLKRRLSK